MRSILRGALVLTMSVATLFGTAPTLAGPIETIFSGRAGCYRRTYEQAHMKAHPRQKTLQIEISYRPQPPERRGAESSRVQVYLFSRYRADTKPLSGGHEAYCRADGPTTSCSVDGDAGGFTLTPVGNRFVRLKIDERLTIETDTNFVEMHASDDRTFVLHRLPAAACTRIQ